MTSKKVNKKHANIWVKAGIILAAGVLISVSVILYAIYSKRNNDLKLDDDSDTAVDSLSATETGASFENVKVSFYDDNDKLIEEKTVAYGEAVFPPVIKNDVPGKVFLGWNRNLSYMTRNTQVYAVYDDYSDKKNVIYFDTVYIDSSETLEIQLKIGGAVDIASFNMKVCYDSSVLHLKELTDVIEGLEFQTSEGEVGFLLDHDKNLTDSGSLATFRFDIENVDFIKTDLVIQLEDGKKLEEGELRYVDCTMVKGNIFIY